MGKEILFYPLFFIIILCSVSTAYSEDIKSLYITDIQSLLKNGVSNKRIVTLIGKHCINFDLSEEYINDLTKLGANDDVITALRTACIKKNIDAGGITDSIGEPTDKNTPNSAGYIKVDSEPSGAKIYVDGNYRESTPTALMLFKGKHSLVLIKENYNVNFITLEIREGVNLPLMEKLHPK